MNIIDGILLFILVISTIYGFYHGFIHSVASLFGLGLSVAAAFIFSPMLASVISGNQGVTVALSSFTDSVARVGDYDLASSPVSGISRNVLDTILKSVSLPEPIANLLQTNIQGQSFAAQGLTSVNDYVSRTVVQSAVNVLSFLACFAAAYLLFALVMSLIKHVFDIPILRQLDWLAGGVFGLARGAALCYLLLLLAPLVQVIVPGDQIGTLLSGSSLASIFQNNGLLVRIITGG